MKKTAKTYIKSYRSAARQSRLYGSPQAFRSRLHSGTDVIFQDFGGTDANQRY